MQQDLLSKSTTNADGEEEQPNILTRYKKGHGKIIYIDSCNLVIQGQEILATNYDDEHKSLFICHINKTTVSQERVKCLNGLYTVDDNVEFTFEDEQFNEAGRPCYYVVNDIHKLKSKKMKRKKNQKTEREKHIPQHEDQFSKCPCCGNESKYEIKEKIKDVSDTELRSRLLYEINYLWMIGMLPDIFDERYNEYYAKLPYKYNLPEISPARLRTLIRKAQLDESSVSFQPTYSVVNPVIVVTGATNSDIEKIVHKILIPNAMDTKASCSSELVYENQVTNPVPPDTPINAAVQNSEADGGAHPKVYSSVSGRGPSTSPDAKTSNC